MPAIAHSTNSGLSWTITAGNAFPALPTSDTDMDGIWGTGSTVFVGSSSGLIYKTTDGTNWSGPLYNLGTVAVAIWGTDASNVYAISGPKIAHTKDGGSTWGVEAQGLTSKALYSIWGSGPNDVYVVGSGGLLLHYSM